MGSNYNPNELILDSFPQIKHLSSSNINKWCGEYGSEGKWYLQYILGDKFKGNPATIRGAVIEEAFVKILTGNDNDVESFVERAFKERCAELEDVDDKAYEKELNSLKGFINQSRLCISELKLKPHKDCLNLTQTKISQKVSDKVPFNVIGYTDLDFVVHYTDIKTTHKMPSDIKQDHKRQISFYGKSRGDTTANILYLTSKKYKMYGLHDREIDVAYEDFVRRAESLCERLEAAAILAEVRGTLPEVELSKIISPDIYSWSWSDEDRYLAAQENLWGLSLN